MEKNKDELIKLIKTAAENGWEPDFTFNGTFTYHILEQVFFIELVENGGKGHHEPKKKHIPYEVALLSHGFAKAIWKEPVKLMTGMSEVGWKYHLQKAVISDDPLEYYLKNK